MAFSLDRLSCQKLPAQAGLLIFRELFAAPQGLLFPHWQDPGSSLSQVNLPAGPKERPIFQVPVSPPSLSLRRRPELLT